MWLNSIKRRLAAFWPASGANVAVMFALSSVPLALGIGVAIDFSRAASVRTQMQAGLDAAVLAGAKASSAVTQSAAVAMAKNVFAGEVATIGGSPTTTFTFNSDGSLSGSATFSLPTSFAGLTGVSALSLGVQATAGGSHTPICVLLLDPTASQSLLANSGTNISAPNCEFDVASTANPGAIFNAGTNISSKKLCLQSANYINNGGTEPNFSPSCAAASNPFIGKLPAPPSTTCSGAYANGGNFSGTVNLSPGVYCGWFNFNNAPTVTFQPGVYVISGGGWNVDGGKWTGSGVTFYFADTSHIQFNSGINATLSAPTVGTYAGILFYEKDGLSLSPFVFDDSVGENLSGLIYLPSRNITFNSTSNVTTPQVTVVADTAIFDTLNWSLTPNSAWPIGGGSGGGAIHLTQ